MTDITADAADAARLDLPVAQRSASALAERMADALRRYPAIGAHERDALIRFARHGAPEDIARAFYVSGLEPQLIAFKKDHPRDFATGLRAWLPLLLMAAAAAAVLSAVRVAFG